MFDKISERQMHKVRWFLAVGWLILIFSLFYDPISSALTHPDNHFSPFSIKPDNCIPFRGECLRDLDAYPLGTSVFWGMIVPSAVMLLLVFGHEAWRRICPLAFFSQISQHLGINRKHRISPDSWLARHHLYFQFGLLFIGLTLRLALFDFNSIALGIFLLLTIFAAIVVGYWYGGRTWCHYFCPMSPVQIVYTGPKGLLGSEAHQTPRGSITQSMCRTVDASGMEKMNCVGCKSHCMDIDGEDSYWDELHKPGRKLVQYGYVGLVIGFFLYYFLYSGSFAYYFSGHWTHRERDWTLFDPVGFYLGDRAIAIPSIVAVALTLALFSGLTYALFMWLEKAYRHYRLRIRKPLKPELISHHIFAIATFAAFNIFFIFGGRPALMKLPETGQILFNWLVPLVSGLWLYQTLRRTNDTYNREKQATSLRRQLYKRAIDLSNYVKDRSLDELTADEVYVLAKVLPDRTSIYKEVLRETLADGNGDYYPSLAVLKNLREELNISEEEHHTVLTELGIEGDLPDPVRQRTYEDRLRVESYRQALEGLLLDLVERGTPLKQAYQTQRSQIERCQKTYHITEAENAKVLTGIFNEDSAIVNTADGLLVQLQNLAVQERSLSPHLLNSHGVAFAFLRTLVREKQKQIVNKLLSILEILGEGEEAIRIAGSTAVLAEGIVPRLLKCEMVKWQERLSDRILEMLSSSPDRIAAIPTQVLRQIGDRAESDMTVVRHPAISPTRTDVTVVQRRDVTDTRSDVTVVQRRDVTDTRADVTVVRRPGENVRTCRGGGCPDKAIVALSELLQDPEPSIQAASLYALHRLDPLLGSDRARQILAGEPAAFLRETAQTILHPEPEISPAMVMTAIAEISVRGVQETRSFQQAIVRVGRGLDNDIVLADTRVSRHHAALYLDDRGVSIQDLDSSNGLRLGDRNLGRDRASLTPGEPIQFGTLEGPTLKVWWEPRPRFAPAIATIEKLFWLFENSIFKYLKTDALIDLAREADVASYAANQEIFSSGVSNCRLGLLMSGEARLLSETGESDENETIVLPGQIIPQNCGRKAIAIADHTRVLLLSSHYLQS